MIYLIMVRNCARRKPDYRATFGLSYSISVRGAHDPQPFTVQFCPSPRLSLPLSSTSATLSPVLSHQLVVHVLLPRFPVTSPDSVRYRFQLSPASLLSRRNSQCPWANLNVDINVRLGQYAFFRSSKRPHAPWCHFNKGNIR